MSLATAQPAEQEQDKEGGGGLFEGGQGGDYLIVSQVLSKQVGWEFSVYQVDIQWLWLFVGALVVLVGGVAEQASHYQGYQKDKFKEGS